MNNSQPVSSETQINRRLRMVAYVFAVLGTIAWVDSARALITEDSLALGTDLLLLPAAIGLIRLRDRWRRLTRAVIAIGGAMAVLVAGLALFVSPPDGITLLGRTIPASGVWPSLTIVLYTAGYVAIAAWIYRLLGAEPVKALFD